MKKYSDKELTPVEYGMSPVKIIDLSIPPETCCFPFHWHDRMELLYVDEGEMFVSCARQDFVAVRGDLVIVNCGQTHAARTGKSPVRYRAFMFELARLSGTKTEIDGFLEPIMNGRTTFQQLVHDDRLKPIFDAMCSEENKGDFAYPLYLKSYVYLLLGHLCRYYINKKMLADTGDKNIYGILEYIDNNFDAELSVAALSEHFNYTEEYFCRKFKKAVGIPPLKYVNMLRLEQAEKLLLSTELTCEEIAVKCGFHDPNYFSRCFSKAFGMTPTARRNADKKYQCGG